jgi:hypothetical protein
MVPRVGSPANLFEGGGGAMQNLNVMASFFMNALQSNPSMMRNLVQQPSRRDGEDDDIELRFPPQRRERELQTALARGPGGIGDSLSPDPKESQPQKESPKLVEERTPMKTKKLRKKKSKKTKHAVPDAPAAMVPYDSKARQTTASLFDKVLDRDAKRKEEAAKRKAEAAAKAKAVLKKPAVSMKRPASWGPLGCSKCRYLVNGCSACR